MTTHQEAFGFAVGGTSTPSSPRPRPRPGTNALEAEAERLVRERASRGGTHCKACGQHVQLYNRRLNSGMAATLIWIVQQQRDSGAFVDVAGFAPRLTLRAKDFSVLVHWGLIEPAPSDDPRYRRSGWWRATEAGIDFARGRTRVRSHVLLYANEVHGFQGRKITIQEALGSGFDYRELVGGAAD